MNRRRRSTAATWRLLPAGWRALTLAFLVAACTGGGGQSPAAGPPESPAPQPSPTAQGSPAEGQFKNPVLNVNFPDPFILKDGNSYYAYATNTRPGEPKRHIQLARSSDLVKWEQLPDALPKPPAWMVKDWWAPEVIRTSAGYVMYYSARAKEILHPSAENAQCISYAISKTPQGPFVDRSTKPFVCQPELGGSIDPSPFTDRDGKRYLTWKNDGNCCALPTRFWIQELSSDGTRLVGRPKDMGVVNDAQWETAGYNLIEAPTLLLHAGTYYLFFSGGAYDSEFYATGYATSQSVTGPYKDAPENPILKRRDGSEAAGPGHQSVIRGPRGGLWMAYHAWDKDAIGDANKGMRSLWLDELVFENGKAVVKGPDDGPQPAP